MSQTEPLRPEEVRRILVLKFRSPGDVLLMIPALKALKQGFPKAEVSVAVNAEAAPLVELHPAVSQVFPYVRAGRPTFWLGRACAELRYGRRIRHGAFDIAINATEGDRGALLALASGAPVRVGVDPKGRGLALKRSLFSHLLRWPWDRHNVLANLELVGLLGVGVSDRRVELALADEDIRSVEARLAAAGIGPGEPLVHVHAPSRLAYKRWRPEAVAAVIDHLALERNVHVALSGAAQDAPYVGQIASLCRSRPLNAAGELTLRQVGALARRATVFLGVDTVVMHMAAAVDTPVVAIFGPTPASVWGPWDNSGPPLQYPARCGVQASGPHVVIQAERDCVPCSRMGCQGSGVSLCLEELSPREVISVIDAALARALARGK